METRRRFLGHLAGALALPALAPPALGAAAPAAGAPAAAAAAGASAWRDVAAQFDLDPQEHFFNTGTLGSCPRPVRQRVIETLEALDARPTFHYWARCMPRYFEIRAKAAALLGVAEPEALTLTHSTTEGINIVARGLDLRPGDEIVMTSHEHPGGDAPWRYVAARRGLTIRRCELPMTPPGEEEIVAGIERLLGPRTRVLMVSHILYTNGLIMPVERLGRLAAERGIELLIDGAHPVGQMPVEIEKTGCGFYAASGHKWLCAPRGTGFLYVRPDLLERVEPLLTAYDPEHVPHDVEAFERGATRLNFVWTNNLHDLMGLEAAIDFHLAIGAARVRERCMELTERFRAGARGVPGLEMLEVPAERSAPMTSLKVVSGRSNKEIFRALAQRGYKVKEVLDSELPEPINAIRVCTHVFNDEEQVDGLVEALAAVMRT